MATSNITNLTNIHELSDGSSAGTRLGQSASDLVAFHGATPSDQRAFTADVSTSVVTTTSPYGFSTSLQATNLIALVNEIKAVLVEKGLMAAS